MDRSVSVAEAVRFGFRWPVARCAVREAVQSWPLGCRNRAQAAPLPCRLGDFGSTWIDSRYPDYVATVTFAHRANHQVPAGNSTSGWPLRHVW